MGSVTAFPHVSRTRSSASLRARHVDGDAFWILELSGEADVATLVMLREELAQMIASRRACLVVDLRGLTFCDVATADVILTARWTAPVTLIGAAGPVKRVLDLLDARQARRRLPRAQGRSMTGSRASGSG